MTKVRVDSSVCELTGFCAALARDLFTLDTGGSHAVTRELTSDERELAIEAAEMCPTRAIDITES